MVMVNVHYLVFEFAVLHFLIFEFAAVSNGIQDCTRKKYKMFFFLVDKSIRCHNIIFNFSYSHKKKSILYGGGEAKCCVILFFFIKSRIFTFWASHFYFYITMIETCDARRVFFYKP